MPLTLRLGRPEDADRCGMISYEAFKTIAEHHRFPPPRLLPSGRSRTLRDGSPTRATT